MSVKLKKDRREPVRIQLKKNDQVKVIAGRDKGRTGRILEVDERTGRVLVEKVNIVKRHMRKNPAKQIAGGTLGLRRELHIDSHLFMDTY